MKTCTKCGETKPVSEFNKRAKSRDGLRYHCRSCDKAMNTAWAAANPDRMKAHAAKYRALHPERQKARKTKRRASDPEAWREADRIYSHNRRARILATGGRLSYGLSAKLFKLQRGKCACGCKQPLGDDYHMDHIMPLALGGTNTDDNIQLLRATCNMKKNAKHPVDFMRERGLLL